MISLKNFFALIVTTVSLGCAQCDTPMYMPKDSDKCESACKKLVSLGCPEGEPIVTQPTISGACTQGIPVDSDASSFGYTCQTPCAEWCRSAQSHGVFLNPTCVVEKLTKCEDLEELCTTNPHK